MDIPFFFSPEIQTNSSFLILDEATSRHAVQVLRMQMGQAIQLTNGKGVLATANISKADKKKMEVDVVKTENAETKIQQNAIAISLLKNAARFEWFLEKATELGIAEIYPIICQRTERQLYKKERWEQILVSAMLQSQQRFLPKLFAPETTEKWLTQIPTNAYPQRFVAHCMDGEKKNLLESFLPKTNSIVMIGPEGDFTQKEVDAAVGKGFVPVSLGITRLRTETAGIVAAVISNFI